MIRRYTPWSIPMAGLTLLIAAAHATAQDAPRAEAREVATWPGVTGTGSVLLPNGWSLDPAGRQVALRNDFPVLIARHPSEPVLAVLFAGYNEHEVVTLDADTQKVIGRVALPASFAGLAWSPDGGRLYVGGGFDDVVHRFDHAGGLLSNPFQIAYGDRPRVAAEPPPDDEQDVRRTPQRVPGGLAISSDGKTLWVANVWGHSVARFDAETGELQNETAIGNDTYPYGLVLDENSGRVYASLWGAASVAVIEAASGDVVGRWETQEHPNEMLLARSGKILYAANANRNTVSVIDTGTGRALETIGTAIAPDAPSGSTPNSIALTADEKVLFVANANTNNLAVVNVETPGRGKPMGFVPVGWYPTCVRLSGDGQTILVANGKGASSRANRGGPQPAPGGRPPTVEYIGGLFEGTLSVIPMPNPAQMAAMTKTVYDCCPLDRTDPAAVVGQRPEGNPIPARVGEASPIKYCLYIIKENRTYDQILGDLPEGNGEPALCLFPEAVTPNHHALARDFVLLDNFYVESEVSADGHEWTMGAYATDFVERTWPLGYRGDRRVPYPAEGNYEIATPAGGYLWHRAADKGVSYFSFGEFIENPTDTRPAKAKIDILEGHFDPQFVGYDLSVTDVSRAGRFLENLRRWEQEGEMPRLITLRLGNDHTSGTRPGVPTPTAMVADNDLALGMVVEGLSRSRFWPEMAVFVVEDDAQNGPDHVDAHRTIAFAASPYTRGAGKDSTMYSTSSMLRTMELILGLDPMSQFDAAATPMYRSFRAEPDPTPYEVRPVPAEVLNQVNTADAWGAQLSQEMNLAQEDQADDLLFNEVIWRSVKGADSPMPAPVRAAFVVAEYEDEEEDDNADDE